MKRLARLMVAALRLHLETKARPRLPEGGAIFWQCFAELSNRRAAAEPLALSEIEAWARLHRLPFGPDHVAVILALDGAWLEEAREATGATAPLDLAGFDALMG